MTDPTPPTDPEADPEAAPVDCTTMTDREYAAYRAARGIPGLTRMGGPDGITTRDPFLLSKLTAEVHARLPADSQPAGPAEPAPAPEAPAVDYRTADHATFAAELAKYGLRPHC